MSDLGSSALVKEAAELVKACTDVVRSVAHEKEAEVGEATAKDGRVAAARGGPLQAIGRLYIALTTVLALAASAAAYFDTHLQAGASISKSTTALRIALLCICCLGVLGGGVLVALLLRRGPSWLFSPTEYSSAVHSDLVTRGERADKPTAFPAGSPTPPRSTPPEAP